MSSTHLSEEMREVEEELEHDSSTHDTQNPRGTSIPLEDVEEGKGGGLEPISTARPRSTSPRPGAGSQRATSPKIALSFPLSGAQKPRSKKSWHEDVKEGVRNALQLLTSPVFAQAFVLTFLGEWGDRSQITTIAMGGAHVRSDFPSFVGVSADKVEHTGHCIRDYSGPWAMYVRSSNGWSVVIDKDLSKAQ